MIARILYSLLTTVAFAAAFVLTFGAMVPPDRRGDPEYVAVFLVAAGALLVGGVRSFFKKRQPKQEG